MIRCTALVDGDSARSDVKSVCGDYPAMMSFDLGRIEIYGDKNWIMYHWPVSGKKLWRNMNAEECRLSAGTWIIR